MNLFHLSPETLSLLQKCIGGTLEYIHAEAGTVSAGDNPIFRGSGMLSIVFYRDTYRYKWRFKFDLENKAILYSECHEWPQTLSLKEQFYAIKNNQINYDQDASEDRNKYPINFVISNKTGELFPSVNTVKSIKIYHEVGIFDNEEAGGPERQNDYLAMIDIETESGRRIIIYPEDVPDCYEIHFDDLERLNYRLAEIHDDSGKTFGQARYLLRYELR